MGIINGVSSMEVNLNNTSDINRGIKQLQASLAPDFISRCDEEARGKQPIIWNISDVQLNTLPEQYRTAVSLHYLQGMSYSMVAEVLQIPEGTVKSHCSRGIKRLRAYP